MEWTPEAKVEYLLRRVTWTVRAETTPEGDRLLRCNEIPDAIGTGDNDEAIEGDFWESLRASMEAYVHFNDRPPVPVGTLLPWESNRPPSLTPMATMVVIQTGHVEQHEQRQRTLTTALLQSKDLVTA